MKHFYLISNPTRDLGFNLQKHVVRYLQERGAECICRVNDDEKPPAGVECIIVLGGDGTLLRVVRQYADAHVSFIGINSGTVGYLTEGNDEDCDTILDHLLEDDYLIDRRMMLQGRIFRDGKILGRHRALNDIVIGRTGALAVIRLNVYVNGQYLCQYSADGTIISTPTGSTAYALSCGGPIVQPGAKLFVLTPISSHSLNNRSIVFSASDKLEVEIAEKNRNTKADICFRAYFDGEKPFTLQIGDRVEISQASTYVTILKLSEKSFIETLRVKLSD